MKIVVINGSPKGKAGNTNVMVDSFLNGAQDAGAEVSNIFLAEKDIKHCKGCLTCWDRGPGQCVTKDDMLEVLSYLGGADIIVFASPVYFENISGMLKVFMDRMTMIGGPQNLSQQDVEEKSGQSRANAKQAPKLMMISSCGYPDKSEFDVTSLWIRRISEKLHMELIGELYTTRGKYLTDTSNELKPAITNYLSLLKKAGKEIVTYMKLSDATKDLLIKVNKDFDIIIKQ